MVQMIFKPALYRYDTCADFSAAFNLGADDLVLTNEYIYKPCFGALNLPVKTLFQEQYGAGEPTDEMVDAIIRDAAATGCTRVIAIGGGTVIDIAKVLAVAGDEGVDALCAGMGSLQKKRKLVIIPTTCGTGSEVTNIAIINRTRIGTKMGLVSDYMYADQAVLIPSMLASLPYEVFATSSIDALIHAVESHVSPKANPFTRAMGRAAIVDIIRGYQDMGTERLLPADMERFLTASTMAGIAFSNAGCAAVHALSYPVGGNYHVPHGKANFMLFEAVFKAYRGLGADLSALEAVLSDALAVPACDVWGALFALLGRIYDNQSLSALGCDAAKCNEMAASVVKEQQRLLANNPVFLSEAQICEIYLSCL